MTQAWADYLDGLKASTGVVTDATSGKSDSGQ